MNTQTTDNDLLREFFVNRNKDSYSFEELLAYTALEGKEKDTRLRDIIKGVEHLMGRYARKITYGQLRIILNMVKNKEFDDKPENLLTVVPKLAYSESRQQSREAKELIGFIRAMAWEVGDDKKRYEAFKNIMDTIVAYHKING